MFEASYGRSGAAPLHVRFGSGGGAGDRPADCNQPTRFARASRSLRGRLMRKSL